jgi:hypothetical protein
VLTDKDNLDLSMKDGKPVAKFNGKEIPFTDVSVKGKGNLATRMTTGDDGTVVNVVISPGNAARIHRRAAVLDLS